MKLYHFSNEKFNILKPSFFGKNFYTKNDVQACNIKRSFAYDTQKPLEHSLTGTKYRYILKVDKNKIYDLDKDKERLKDKFKYDIDKILNYIKRKFYGASYTTSFKCYAIFKNVKVVKQDILY